MKNLFGKIVASLVVVGVLAFAGCNSMGTPTNTCHQSAPVPVYTKGEVAHKYVK